MRASSFCAFGAVHVHEPEFPELQRHDAPLGIQVREAQAVQRLQRLLFAEYSRAGVTLLLGIAPVLAVLRQVERGLALLQLRFLQGNRCRLSSSHTMSSKPFFSTARKPFTFHETKRI